MEVKICLHFERGKEMGGGKRRWRRREGGFQGGEARRRNGRGLLLYGRACRGIGTHPITEQLFIMHIK